MKNNEIKNLLKNSIIHNKILHSYMFVGGKFSSKEDIAKKMAKHILCINKQGAACEECNSCIKFNASNHPDFKIIEVSDNDNSLKIEQIREMQDDIIKKPIISEKKVYVIKDADKMTIGAQNCLLKTLEEPPLYITIILLIENESLILNTIKSRCTKIVFTEDTKKEMTEEEKGIYLKLEEIFSNISNYTLLDVLNKIDILYNNEKKIYDILDYTNDILYKNIKNNINNIKYIEFVEDTKKRLNANANFNMCIDNLLYNIWKE